MKTVEALSKMIERFPQNDGKDFHYLIDLSSKYPDFRIINLMIMNFPVDLFNVEQWNKAELYARNNNEILENYFPKVVEFKQTIHVSTKNIDKTKLLERQKELINNFLNR
jgi:hypothetical protein